jgi:hypothetical protein
MNRGLGLVLMVSVVAFACSEKTSLNNSQPPGSTNPDAEVGGSGGSTMTSASGGQSTSLGGSTPQGGSSTAGTSGAGGLDGSGGMGSGGRTGGTASSGGSYASGGMTFSSGGAGPAGGTSTAKGGATGSGGSATGGALGGTSARGGATAGSGGRATGGTPLVEAGGSQAGGQTGSTAPANDSPGQNPFTRPASSGILITSSDGLNGIDLILAADGKDGMFVAGATRNPQAMGLAAFDPGMESEAFAARLDSQGKLVWSVPLKTCGVPADVAAGPDDSVFVLCPYEPDVTSLMPASCDAAASVEKLAGSDGKLIFDARVSVPAMPSDGFMCPYGLGVDAQGRSYVGGAYVPNPPNERVVLIAVTAKGQQDWTLISDGPANDPTSDSAVAYVNDVDVDSNGNVLFVGGFNNWMKLGATQLTSQASTGQYSMYNGFFARVAADNTAPASWRFGGATFDLATALAPTGNGGFVLAGWAWSNTSIGGKSMTASKDGSALIAQITSQGQATWARVVPGTNIADDIAVGPDGKVYVVGQFEADELLYAYDPASDVLTTRKTTAGNATNNALRTRSIAVSTSGAVWLSGTFEGTINLGTGALSTSTVAAFLIKLN